MDTWENHRTEAVRRLVLEHDDIRFDAHDVLWLHARTGVKPIFDHPHFWCLNLDWLGLVPSFEKFLASWPEAVRPKMHFSSPRTELREVKRAVPPGRVFDVMLAAKAKDLALVKLRADLLRYAPDVAARFGLGEESVAEVEEEEAEVLEEAGEDGVSVVEAVEGEG